MYLFAELQLWLNAITTVDLPNSLPPGCSHSNSHSRRHALVWWWCYAVYQHRWLLHLLVDVVYWLNHEWNIVPGICHLFHLGICCLSITFIPYTTVSCLLYSGLLVLLMDSIINCRFARRVSCGIPTFSANTQYGTCNLDCDSPDERLYKSVEANGYNHRNVENLTFNPNTRSQHLVSMTPVFQPLQVNDIGPVLIERACPIPCQRRFEASCQIIKKTILKHATLNFHVTFVSELFVISDNSCPISELQSVSKTSVPVARAATCYFTPSQWVTYHRSVTAKPWTWSMYFGWCWASCHATTFKELFINSYRYWKAINFRELLYTHNTWHWSSHYSYNTWIP